jgi:hypothetical protein
MESGVKKVKARKRVEVKVRGRARHKGDVNAP